jgi:EAL domain-containing protein (putative c-di-GMP-specific phosphodiesterase class I)
MIIEITETTALRDLKETAYFIATLQDTGCMFALDDFGSGYTSFRQIRALSFDFIKIDGSLISDIATNEHNRLLVKSLLEYMKGLKVKTVAEFVETGETAKILMDYGIDYMQGNYFGKAA